MFLIKMIGFCKSSGCPDSQVLLDFQTNSLPSSASVVVAQHIESCDFCGGEVDLYSQFPQSDEKIPVSEIPAPLFELAQILLNHHHKDSTLLDRLLIEDKGLTLKEAC